MSDRPHPIPQLAMIERVRQLCLGDGRVVAAVMFGSFARGEGDAYSDVEFALFLEDDVLPQFDRAAWVAQVAPVELAFADDFGHFTAIFANLVRGEFLFEPHSNTAQEVSRWVGSAFLPRLDDCLLKDRDGALAPLLQPLATLPRRDAPEAVSRLKMSLVNAVLFGITVLRRGETARALELLGLVHRYLLWLTRLDEGQTDHWPTPSRCLESDLSPQAYERFRECTAALDVESLWRAYRASWAWGRELLAELGPTAGTPLPTSLADKLDERLREGAG